MRHESAYPRVLVVAAAPVGGISGTGVTLTNLFKGWPADSLGQIHTTEDRPRNAQFSLRLPDTFAPFDVLGRAVVARSGAQPSSAPAIAAVPLATGAPRSARRHAALRAVADLSPLRYPPELRNLISEFRPHVIYSPLGSARIVKLAGRVAALAGAPLVPHFMDDWPHTLYSSGELRGLARRSMRHHLRSTLRHASVGLAISQPMADEYAAEFGFPFLPFANPASVPERVLPSSSGSDVGFVYVGGLHLGRWSQLMEIASALASFPGATLTVFAPEKDLRDRTVPSELESSLILGGSLSPDEAVGAMCEADVLVHVESFDAETLAFTRLSMSTKVSQYLATGRPVLGFGPATQASMAHVKALKAGYVATSRGELHDAIAKLVASPTEREAMGAAGRAWAVDKVEAQQVRSAFRQALWSASTVK